jgi:hypothetical protein
VARFVAALHRAGIYVLLNLHTAAPGKRQSRKEAPMADRDHAPDFWTSVARRFRSDPAVIFDLYNEPKHISWACWRNGCRRYAGMNTLTASVRRAGARQPVMADGLNYGNDLSGWLAHAPRDRRRQLIAGFHTYGDLGCRANPCWDHSVVRVAARVPIITGETGEFDCAHGYIDRFLPWADSHGISYLAWAWNATDCAREPSLLAVDGSPSPYGVGYRDHLLARARERAGIGGKPRAPAPYLSSTFTDGTHSSCGRNTRTSSTPNWLITRTWRPRKRLGASRRTG